jgi:hypothetical protein
MRSGLVVTALVLGSLALSADMMAPDSPAEHQYIWHLDVSIAVHSPTKTLPELSRVGAFHVFFRTIVAVGQSITAHCATAREASHLLAS